MRGCPMYLDQDVNSHEQPRMAWVMWLRVLEPPTQVADQSNWCVSGSTKIQLPRSLTSSDPATHVTIWSQYSLDTSGSLFYVVYVHSEPVAIVSLNLSSLLIMKAILNHASGPEFSTASVTSRPCETSNAWALDRGRIGPR